jgi:hypothetical protein
MDDGTLPIVWDQKKKPILHLCDSEKWKKKAAAEDEKARRKNKVKGGLRDAGVKSTVINIISSGEPSFILYQMNLEHD